MINKLSIIIIALNEEKYISNLLDSLKEQTLQNFEIIVVNNNSKDHTKEIAESYFNIFKRYKVIELKEILGPGYARNFGAKFARYNDLLFLDSDTVLEKNFIEKLYNKKIENDFDVAAFLLKIDQSFWINILYLLINFSMKVINIFGIHPALGGIGIFCRKDIFYELNGFDEIIAFGEDAEFTQRASKIGKYKLINLKNSSSPRRYDSFKSFIVILYYNIYRIFLKKEIYNKKSYLFGKF